MFVFHVMFGDADAAIVYGSFALPAVVALVIGTIKAKRRGTD